ncbi:hypothetical protein [Streptomyces sp. NPDC088141]|uniref:hypothetical protein n=1 Tax=unclassified Streptomyces TaxID=2593676 RepID=UPI003424AFCA
MNAPFGLSPRRREVAALNAVGFTPALRELSRPHFMTVHARPAAPAASGYLRDARERLFTLPKVDYHRSDTWPTRIDMAFEQVAARHRSAAHAAMGAL